MGTPIMVAMTRAIPDTSRERKTICHTAASPVKRR
jgi:hypothetical protein